MTTTEKDLVEAPEKPASIVAADILERMKGDDTKNDARLMIVYRDAGAFRRILVEDLDRPKRGEAGDPAYALTGAMLRAICDAAGDATPPSAELLSLRAQVAELKGLVAEADRILMIARGCAGKLSASMKRREVEPRSEFEELVRERNAIFSWQDAASRVPSTTHSTQPTAAIIEQCAKIADEDGTWTGSKIASRIRALLKQGHS
jgi:hypothetical protein